MYQIIINTMDKQIAIPIKDEEAIKILNEIDYATLTKTKVYEKVTSSYIKNVGSVIIERDITYDD